jgi:hypothetical protein
MVGIKSSTIPSIIPSLHLFLVAGFFAIQRSCFAWKPLLVVRSWSVDNKKCWNALKLIVRWRVVSRYRRRYLHAVCFHDSLSLVHY